MPGSARGRQASRTTPPKQNPSVLRFGVITDVHQDVMHDAVDRIKTFARAMEGAGVDFAIQLGDFCQPKPANDAFLQAWNSIDAPRHHVIGNHDMDGGFSREQVVEYYGMPARHYSFDAKGLHFIILDGNDPGGTSSGYARFIGKDQLEWLEEDLRTHPLPTVVFVHQPPRLLRRSGQSRPSAPRARVCPSDGGAPGGRRGVLRTLPRGLLSTHRRDLLHADQQRILRVGRQ